MPNRRDEWVNDFRQQRAEQIRRRYQPRIRRKPLDGGVDRDRGRTITPEQLEHEHDSNAYELAMYDANQDKPTEQETASSPAPMPTVSDPAILDYENNLYHRLGLTPPSSSQSNGQASSSDSGKHGSADSSQTEDSSDADRGKDETRTQVVLRDIAEVQDDFGTSGVFDGIDPDRWHRYSNLDLILVKQDIETRPHIFQHCFQHSASQQDALECIYGFPPIFNERELSYLYQAAENRPNKSVGRGGGGAEGNGDDSINNGPMSRQLVSELEERVKSKYAIEIKWGEGSQNTNRLKQLQNLDKAIAYILDYLRKEIYGNDAKEALAAFKRYFAKNEHGQLIVRLGDDIETGGISYGSVTLVAQRDKDGNIINSEKLKTLYLGSAVDIPTIVHEFGHVIDRSLSIEDKYRAANGQLPHWIEWRKNTGLPLNDLILQYAIGGFAGKEHADEEVWADLFMTAVLDSVIGGPLKVYSSTHDRIVDLSPLEFDNCKDEDGRVVCEYRPVKWVEEENYGIQNYTVLPKDQFPILLRSLLGG